MKSHRKLQNDVATHEEPIINRAQLTSIEPEHRGYLKEHHYSISELLSQHLLDVRYDGC